MGRFEVHVIMRTIKNIIKEPFVEVITVPSGVGGSEACYFFEQYKKEVHKREACTYENIQQWILKWFRNIFESCPNDPVKKAELTVMSLEVKERRLGHQL